MTKSEIIRKLTSRKLWLAVALFVSGLIVALGGEKETAETVSGCIMQGAAVLGYLLAEGLTDAANAKSTGAVEVLPGIDVDILTDDQLRSVLQQMGYAYTDGMTREEMLAALDETAAAVPQA
jgi:hypothetical protein